ncbi:hypothetical protein [Elioraea sp.]|uniref:hypothetical protein n=1 Tax=Elioraea sp. TaxID=2185103 RepID=UPI003F6FDEDA
MTRAFLVALAVAAAPGVSLTAELPPAISQGILVDELPLRPRPAPGSGTRVEPPGPRIDPPGAAAGTVELAPGTTLAPGFFSSRPIDAPLDGPTAGVPQRGVGDRLLEVGPGVVLQRRF